MGGGRTEQRSWMEGTMTSWSLIKETLTYMPWTSKC